jgi:hypothetical protein
VVFVAHKVIDVVPGRERGSEAHLVGEPEDEGILEEPAVAVEETEGPEMEKMWQEEHVLGVHFGVYVLVDTPLR